MTARAGEPGVVVLDLRAGGGDVADVEGSVLVLDDAKTAAEHDDVYQALLGSPRVSGVICLAVDGGGGEVSVGQPPSLGPAERGATLWVGDQHGIRWRPTERTVRKVGPTEPSGLSQLVTALREPAVFDAVVTCVSTLRYSTASAGLALERTTLHESELRRVEGEAVTQFTDPDAGRVAAQELPRGELRAAVRAVVPTDPTENVLVAGGELATARARVIIALDAADHEITRLDDWLAPFPRDRPGQVVGAAVEEARSAARDYHGKVCRQLLRLDGNLRGERVPGEVVTQLGVRPPVPARPREVRDQVRGLVVEWLGRYRSVARLRPDLDAERIGQEPQGCSAATAELATLEPPTGPMPEFGPWPPPHYAVPLVTLSGALAVLGVAPVVLLPVLTLAWFVVGLLGHARRPTATGEPGILQALAPAAQGWGLPVLVGASLALVVSGGAQVPFPWDVALTLLAGSAVVATAAVGWRRAVRRWRRSLAIDELRACVDRTDQLLDTSLRAEWRCCARRALLAEGLRQACVGLTAVGDLLARRGGDLFAVPAGDGDGPVAGASQDPDAFGGRDVFQEVREVVVTDLVDLTVAALAPCWAGIEAGRPAEPAEYVREAERLLAGYREHVARHGLLAPPPFARHQLRRAELATRLWAGSRVAEALSCDVGDTMTQLCDETQLGSLSAMAGGAELVRFAPAAVRELGRDPTGPGPAVTWTGDTEIAGTLRLVPLRQGVFQ